MSANTSIEWTDRTWNPVRGCSRVSAGCMNCYAERVAHRFSGPGKPYEGLTKLTSHGPVWTGDVRLVPEALDEPLHWRKPQRIFVNSMSDLFHEGVPFEFIANVFHTMYGEASTQPSPQHTYQILTKRPERMLEWFRWLRDHERARAEAYIAGLHSYLVDQGPHPRVWLGVSVEDQATADERIPILLQVPAAVRWISAEPLLGPLDLTSVEWPDKGGHRVDVLRRGYWNDAGWIACGPSAKLGAPRGGFTNHSDMTGVDWVVAGGESGPKARPMHPDWARSLRDQCAAAGVPFLFKQWGEWAPRAAEGGVHYEGPALNEDRVHWLWPDARHESVGGGSIREGDGHVLTHRIGKTAAGRMLDGRTWDLYPA